MNELFLRCKRSIAVLMTSILCVSFFCVVSNAQDTKDTKAQGEHTIDVSVDAGGVVIGEDGEIHKGDFTVQVEDGGAFTLKLWPNTGYEPVPAVLDDQELPVSDRKLEVKDVTKDGALKITWKKVPFTPIQKNYTIAGTVTENGRESEGITLELQSRPTPFVTEADGRFRFDNVKPGTHSLIAQKGEKMAGAVSFVLEKGEDVSVDMSDGVYRITAGNHDTLELAIALNGDGTMKITAVKALAAKDLAEQYPEAADHTIAMGYWVGLAAVLVLAFIAYRNLRHRKKSK